MSNVTPTNADAPQRPWWRVYLLFAVLLALVVFGVVYFLVPGWMLNSKVRSFTPAAPFDLPAEIVYSPAPIPAENNGFVTLQKACALVPDRPQTFGFDIAWKGAVEREWLPNLEVERYLSAMRPAMEMFDQALKQTQWRCTELETRMAQLEQGKQYSPVPQMQLEMIAHAEVATASRLLAEGNVDQAVAEGLKLVELGRRLQGCQGMPTEFIYGALVEGLGFDVLSRVLDSPKTKPEHLQSIASSLPDNQQAAANWATTLKIELYVAIHDFLENPSAKTKPLPDLLLDKNATKRNLAANVQTEFKNAVAPYSARDRSFQKRCDAMGNEAQVLRSDVDFYRETGRATWGLVNTPNAYGIWLEYFAAPVTERSEVMRRQHLFLANTIPAIAALMLHRDKFGALPDTLDALVDKQLLRALPVDPFDFKTLRYSKEKSRLWSVGMDGNDDGGAPHAAGLGTSGDIVIEIPALPEPPKTK